MNLAVGLASLSLSACATAPLTNPWSEHKTPWSERARSIGGYTAGCLAGATSLTPDGPGFQLMRLSRGRFYGHPRLIAWLEQYGRDVQKAGLGVALVGDLSQARGGPMIPGHASHQIGLDADIWFWAPSDAATRSLTLLERETFSARSVAPETSWDENRHARLVELAAGREGVERVFVNAVIKRRLCARFAGATPPEWMARVRPWHGHEDHLHVRLSCTPGESDCQAQAPVTEGHGCDATLDWWFTDEARQKAGEPGPRVLPKLPEACAELLGPEPSKSSVVGKYPEHWFAPVPEAGKPAWEILPQAAGPGEVILSKRNELGLLSNFSATPFELWGKKYASLEGFWQMMLFPEGPDDPRARDPRIKWKHTREQVSRMVAFEAKKAGQQAEENMKKLGIDWVSFEGKRFPYRSKEKGEHYRLILEATWAKLRQNPKVREVLMATGDLKLKPDHHPEPDSPPEWRYFELWEQIRDELKRMPESTGIPPKSPPTH